MPPALVRLTFTVRMRFPPAAVRQLTRQRTLLKLMRRMLTTVGLRASQARIASARAARRAWAQLSGHGTFAGWNRTGGGAGSCADAVGVRNAARTTAVARRRAGIIRSEHGLRPVVTRANNLLDTGNPRFREG